MWNQDYVGDCCRLCYVVNTRYQLEEWSLCLPVCKVPTYILQVGLVIYTETIQFKPNEYTHTLNNETTIKAPGSAVNYKLPHRL